jgi:diadenosine tetraphosphate (Ap4A) HIT family hydrolase
MQDHRVTEDRDRCPLCESIAGRSPVPLDGPWITAGRAVAIPARGHLVAGHMLVCSAEHHPNLLSSPAPVQADVLALVAGVRDRLAGAFSLQCFAFEHGLIGRNRDEIGCSIDHVHLHVMPLPAAVIAKAREWLAGFSVLGNGVEVDTRRYLLGQFSDSGNWYVSPPGHPICHRHFLKLIDEELGRTSRWDEAVVDSGSLILAAFQALDLGPNLTHSPDPAGQGALVQ